MDELFMSEINQPVSYRLVSFKQLQMSSLLSQIQNFSNIHLTLFFIRIKTISEIVFSQLITDTRKATLMQVQFGFTMISDLSTLQSEKYQIHTHTHQPKEVEWLAHAHAMDELFMSEIKQPVSYQLVSIKQLHMSSLLSQIRSFSNFHLILFSIGIKTISEIVFSQPITYTRKATLMQVQFGFTMLSDQSLWKK